MAFSVPSLSEVSRTVENGFSSAFYGKSGTLRVGVLKVLSKVVAGAAYLPILFCQYIWRNSFVDSADAENLVRFGAWYNVPHKVASYSRGVVTVYGTGTLPAGIVLEDDSGHEYETITAVTMTTAGVDVNVAALNPGSEYNLDEDSNINSQDEIDGFTSAIVADGGIYGGVSVEVVVDGSTEYWGETVEEYRSRIKYRRQHPPMGGCDADYVQWAKKFSQVTDCWVFGNYPTTNSVAIYVSDFNSDNPQLNDTELEEIVDYITDEQRKPITANVLVASPSAVTVGVTVTIPVVNESSKTKVTDTLKEYLRAFGPGDTITIDGCNAAITAADIVDSSKVTNLKVDGATISSGSYTLPKTGSSSDISGRVVNINKLSSSITFNVG